MGLLIDMQMYVEDKAGKIAWKPVGQPLPFVRQKFFLGDFTSL